MGSNLKRAADIYFDLFDVMMTYNHKVLRSVSMPLTLNYFIVLCYLEFNGMGTITEIATHLSISKQQMSTIVDKLLKKELIERKLMSNDRRYSQIKLSEKGLKFVREHRHKMKNSLMSKIVDLSDAEIKQFDESIKVVKATMEKMFDGR